MKKFILTFVIGVLLIAPIDSVLAQSSAQARQSWLSAQEKRLKADTVHQDAKRAYEAEKTPENEERFVVTAKDVMNAVLDEVSAWLVWKNVEAEESQAPDSIKQAISTDVEKNKQKVEVLRKDVDSIQNPLGVGLVFIKMVGNYLELLTDVARNSGNLWVYLGNSMVDRAENYEHRLRKAAENVTDNADIVVILDEAQKNIKEARINVSKADSSYTEVVTPGKPLVKFGEGNQYLRNAKSELRDAQSNLLKALELILASQ